MMTPKILTAARVSRSENPFCKGVRKVRHGYTYCVENIRNTYRVSRRKSCGLALLIGSGWEGFVG